MQTYIFTEAFNCGEITRISVESFCRCHPDKKVHVFGTDRDFAEMGDIMQNENVIKVNYTGNNEVRQAYTRGHAGTAYVFAKVLSGQEGGEYERIIHFDGDVFFKLEVVCSYATDEWFDWCDIWGSRRCYKNNPAGIVVDPSLPDTVSTYFFGIKRSAIPKYDFSTLCRMCEASYNPLGHSVFDFFDPVTFVSIRNGARIKFIDPIQIGGQNAEGNKKNSFTSNMHLDMGMYIAHFGGVGSGYAYGTGRSVPPDGYGRWALGRYALFMKLFYDIDTGFRRETMYGHDGRWINGSYDEKILETVKEELGFYT